MCYPHLRPLFWDLAGLSDHVAVDSCIFINPGMTLATYLNNEDEDDEAVL